MIRYHSTCESRLLNRISDYFVHGPNEKERPINQVHILNFSDYDLHVSLVEDDQVLKNWLIYPLVIGQCERPATGQYYLLQCQDKVAKLDAAKLKKKQNAFIGEIDLKNLKIPGTHRLWVKEVLTKSDTIRIVDEGCLIEYREPKSSTIMYKFAAITILIIIILICLIICWNLIKDEDIKQP